MTLAIVFRPEAQVDLLQTCDWYEEQHLGLGRTFSVALDEAIIRIRAMPQMYPKVLREVRRAKLRTFPYLIYYRVLLDRIEVLAVLHGSRDPRLWQKRVN